MIRMSHWLLLVGLAACTHGKDSGNESPDSGRESPDGGDEGADAAINCDGELGAGPDLDGDGYSAMACGGTDIDDNDPLRHPGEECDGVDNDGDGQTDEANDGRALCSEGFLNVCLNGRCQIPPCPVGSRQTSHGCVSIQLCASQAAARCLPGSCTSNASQTDFTCSCPEGFEGSGTKVCSCPSGTWFSQEQGICRAPAWESARPIAQHIDITVPPAWDIGVSGRVVVMWGEDHRVLGHTFSLEADWPAEPREIVIAAGDRPISLDAAALAGLGLGIFTVGGDTSLPTVYTTTLTEAAFESPRRADGQIPFWAGSLGVHVQSDGIRRALYTWSSKDTADGKSHTYIREYSAESSLDTPSYAPQRQAEGSELPTFGFYDDNRSFVAVYADSFSTFHSNSTLDDTSWAPLQPDMNIRLPVVFNSWRAGVGGTSSLTHFGQTTWSTPEAMGSNATAVNIIDNVGDVSTFWIEGTTVRYRSQTNGVWSASQSLFDSSEPLDGLKVAYCGGAMVVWRNGTNTVRARRYTSGLGWQSSQVVRVAPGTEVSALDVRCDLKGRALALWLENASETDQTIMAARFY